MKALLALRKLSTRRPVAVLAWLVMGLVLAFAVRKWIWMPAIILGQSMAPTLLNGQIIGINKLVYRFQVPHRGDVVAVWTGRELVIKRIVGLPGERVAVRNGALFVNGRYLHEPYAVPFGLWRNITEGQIPANCFVVMGDNRSETVVALISRWRIVGRCSCGSAIDGYSETAAPLRVRAFQSRGTDDEH